MFCPKEHIELSATQASVYSQLEICDSLGVVRKQDISVRKWLYVDKLASFCSCEVFYLHRLKMKTKQV